MLRLCNHCAGCDGRLDIVLVIQSSNNIRRERYPLVLSLLASIVDQFEVSPDKTRFGALIYSQATMIQFHLNEYDNKHDVMIAVKRLPFLGGRTRVANALRLMVSAFSTSLAKALSTLSQNSATVAENGETTATVAEFGDSRTFLRQIVALFCDSVDRLLRPKSIKLATFPSIRGSYTVKRV